MRIAPFDTRWEDRLQATCHRLDRNRRVWSDAIGASHRPRGQSVALRTACRRMECEPLTGLGADGTGNRRVGGYRGDNKLRGRVTRPREEDRRIRTRPRTPAPE